MLAAVGFPSGRDNAAKLAVELSKLQSGERLVDVGCGPVSQPTARTSWGLI